VQLSIFDIVAGNIKIVGSTLGNRVDLAKTFELQAAGKTKVITEVRKLEQVNFLKDQREESLLHSTESLL
jgi:propanol-preferring alcohol dehydrogenase